MFNMEGVDFVRCLQFFNVFSPAGNDKDGDKVITNHVCQHGGKSWPYWFRKMGMVTIKSTLFRVGVVMRISFLFHLGTERNKIFIIILLILQKTLPILAHTLFSCKCC